MNSNYPTSSFLRSSGVQKIWKPASLLALLALTPFALTAQDKPVATTGAPATAENPAQGQTPVVKDVEGAMTETVPSMAPVKEGELWDKVWGAMEFYKNPENKIIQSLKFTGRFQADYAWVGPTDYDDLSIRRFRVGMKAKMFQDWTVHAEVDLAPDDNPAYNRMTDAYIAWSKTKNLEIAVGKQSAPFTMDGSTSSKALLGIDRSNVANNMWFTQEYFPGVTFSGAPNKWRYLAGAYATGNDQDEFGHFDGSAFGLGTVGYDFGESLNAKEAVLAANYVYNGLDNDGSTRSLEQVASLNFTYAQARWGVRTDLTGGIGYQGQSDLWGAMVMPYYDITKKLQAVARYTFVTSADPNGVRLNRYENQTVSGRGNEYNEFYLGLNYYFYGNKLKVQTGVDYANMQDEANDGGAYSGWGWTTAFRLSW
jgi:phosphate-selective porin OprO/OprP